MKKIAIRHLLSFILLLICSEINLQAQVSNPPLQDFSPFPFGAAVSVNRLKTNPQYRELVAREYNSVTPENAMKFSVLHPSQSTYYWDDGDTLVNFAEAYNKRIHGHTLIWHNSLPLWVTNFVGDSAAWENILRSHIETVVLHYKDRLVSWDVVNEAFNDDGTLRNSVWLQHLGRNYIARAFQYAHAADPAALLFYNDYGHEYSTPKLSAIKKLVDSLVAAGIPIHGVGLQLHTDKFRSNNSISNAIDTMLATGLKVHIAEWDVAMNPENNASLTYTNVVASQLFGKYKFISRLAKKIPAGKLYGITTWNVTDADSWIPTTYSRPDWPLPFNASYQKKLAFQGIKDGVTRQWNYDATGGQSLAGTYDDIDATGTLITTGFTGNPMGTNNDNSSVQNIGFDFLFNGTTYTQFVLNTNGYIKLGGSAPSATTIFYTTFNGNGGGVINATDIDLIYPYNHDLQSSASGPARYRLLVAGAVGSRVCTIQFKSMSDVLAPTQYTYMEFQVKLYEGTNAIEFVYGNWVASGNASTSITGAVGIKGTHAAESVNVAKASMTAWNTPQSVAATYYFQNGNYPPAGPQFNSRNTFLPDRGRTYRFIAVKQNQSITFNALPEKKMGDEDFDPLATATSGLPVSCSSANESVATIVNGKIHIVGAGTSEITASQSGDAFYNAASSVKQMLIVVKKDQTITFNPLNQKQAGDADFDAAATTDSGLPITYTSSNEAVATIVNGLIHIVNAGTSEITAIQTGDDNYNAAISMTQTLTVLKIYYTDTDHDGYGSTDTAMLATPVPPEGYATNNLDCDDNRILYADNDGDGLGTGEPAACGVANNSDCDDTNPVQLTAVIPDVYALNAASSAKNTIYIGYGPTSLTIEVMPSGGTSPYNYRWNTNETTQAIAVSSAGTYTVDITDAKGCQTSVLIIINLIDVRCGNKNDKVIICHKGANICVSSGSSHGLFEMLIPGFPIGWLLHSNSVQAHLNHGDKLGMCSSGATASAMRSGEAVTEQATPFTFVLYPNPVSDDLNIQISKLEEATELRIYNSQGVLVRSLRLTNVTRSISLKELTAGIYYVQVSNRGNLITKKIIKK